MYTAVGIFHQKNYKMLPNEKHSVETSWKGDVWRMEKVGIISRLHNPLISI